MFYKKPVSAVAAMISVIVPVHNEASILMANVTKLKKFLENRGMDHEIILAVDGSLDGSELIAKRLESPDIHVLASEKRLGRGLALNNAIKSAYGEIVIYMDADLATDLRFLEPAIKEINDGADICTGSRLINGSKVNGRSILREIFSRGYNLMLRLMFDTKIRDHQCGFKAFRKSSVLPLLDKVENRHWFWDSELMIRAQMEKLVVSEIPVEWTDRKKSGVELHVDVVSMGLSAFLLRIHI